MLLKFKSNFILKNQMRKAYPTEYDNFQVSILDWCTFCKYFKLHKITKRYDCKRKHSYVK